LPPGFANAACVRCSISAPRAPIETAAAVDDDAFLLEVEDHVQHTRPHDTLARSPAGAVAASGLPAAVASLAR
jgi:hypothetical protein